MTTSSSPPQAPDCGEATGAAVAGVDGYLVRVRARITSGLSSCTVTGTGYSAEMADRVRAAIINSGLPWPAGRIAVEADPPGLRYCGLDLPAAVAVLTAAGIVPERPSPVLLCAELGLDGRLRTVRGIIPAVTAAAQAGHRIVILAPGDAAAAVTVPGVSVVPCESLRAVVAWLGGRLPPLPLRSRPGGEEALAGLTGQPDEVRLAVQASAAGGHHLCVTGPRGPAARTAAAMRPLLPDLGTFQAAEARALHSLAGAITDVDGPDVRPPWRVPHHTVTMAAMAGGGPGLTRPGEAALAHGGVLFLDQAPAFARDVLTGLRQPLTSGQVTVARGHLTAGFPARFTLAVTMTPCPCDDPAGCGCTPLAARRWRARTEEPLGSFLTVRVAVTAADPARCVPGEPSRWADQVADAGDRARRRYRGTPWTRNADVPAAELAANWPPEPGAPAGTMRMADLGRISSRAVTQVARLAWTLADLAGKNRPGPAEYDIALCYFLGSGSPQPGTGQVREGGSGER